MKKPLVELNRVREWAQEKIDAGSEPPWAWYQYMRLIDTVSTILDGMNATTTENSPQSAQHQEKPLRLVDSTCRPSTLPLRRAGPKVRMPM